MSNSFSNLDLLFAAGLQKQKVNELHTVFNWERPDLPPTKHQEDVLRDSESTVIYAVGGNRCQSVDTPVITTKGIKPIQDVRPGDFVYDENGDPIRVLKSFKNGKKPVVSLRHRSWEKAKCTLNHQWVVQNSSKKHKGSQVLPVEQFSRDTQIQQVQVKSPLGEVHEPHAYAIGALLGDGCSLATMHQIYISSIDSAIPTKVATQLSGNLKKLNSENYTWSVGKVKCNNYDAWCKKRKAHEKIADLDIIKTWDRESLLQYVAGLLDTDGSVYIKENDILTIRWEMQAETVIDSLQYALLALWQIDSSILINDREKSVNGPTRTVGIYNSKDSKIALKELDQYLVTSHKKYQDAYNDLTSKRTSDGWCGVRIIDNKEVVETYDIHVDSPTNLYCLANGLVTHNSGKSQLGGRIITWWFNETHPYMDRPTDWGKGPLTLIVIGRVSEQIESELFAKKIKPYLEEGTYKVHRTAGNLARIVHNENGNRIIFFSHHNINEAREKVQAFTTNVIWLDEMANSASFIGELITRLITTAGKLICTFTPLIRSEEVRRLVDTPTKISKKYVLSMLDNPILTEDPKKMELALEAYANLSESERRTRLYGEWYIGDNAVYPFDSTRNIRSADGYSYSWRHIAVVDPAAAGKSGLSVWAEDPKNGKWFCIKAEYIDGPIASGDLVELVENKIRNYHIIRRVADPHETNFFIEAGKRKLHYMGVYKKTSRKKELIDQLKNALVNDEIVLSPPVLLLINEFISCQWKDGIEHEKIINSSSYHLLDTAQYFLDNKPKFTPSQPQDTLQSFEARLRQSTKEKKQRIAKAKLKRGKRWKR